MQKYACDGYYGDESLFIKGFDNVGDTVDMCANINSLSDLPENYTYTDNGVCNCCECADVTIDATNANDGKCTVWYNTCWDANGSITLYGMEINANEQITLNNVITDTLCVVNNTLNNSGTPVVPIIS